MRVCGSHANRKLTGEQGRDPLGRQLVRLREEVHVRERHVGAVPEASERFG